MAQDWQSTLDRLYGLANWETRPPGSRPNLELARMRRLLEAMGDPQSRWAAIHVGGTNGKGSTASMIELALRKAGYRTGLYSSPHLHSVRERIRIDGELIEADWMTQWLKARDGLLRAEPETTTFEALTAIAFEAFADAAVDVGIIEVGLGGRLDSTNVLEPALSVLTPIGMDHAAVLGPTPEIIARDKAGIIKSGAPVVSAPQLPEVAAVLRDAAAKVDSPIVDVDRAYRWRLEHIDHSGQHFLVQRRQRSVAAAEQPEERHHSADPLGGDGLTLSLVLPGSHQRSNAATALAAVECLAERGWRVGIRHLAQALPDLRWPGRFERFASESGPDRLLVDGAHNPPAAVALRRALNEVYPDRPLLWLIGFSLDKDIDAVLTELLPPASRVFTARAAHPRAMAAADACRRAEHLGHQAEACGQVGHALARALEEAGSESLIVATGSIFVAAEARSAWFERLGLPLPPMDPPLKI